LTSRAPGVAGTANAVSRTASSQMIRRVLTIANKEIPFVFIRVDPFLSVAKLPFSEPC
jgi:hypothetical protein